MHFFKFEKHTMISPTPQTLPGEMTVILNPFGETFFPISC